MKVVRFRASGSRGVGPPSIQSNLKSRGIPRHATSLLGGRECGSPRRLLAAEQHGGAQPVRSTVQRATPDAVTVQLAPHLPSPIHRGVLAEDSMDLDHQLLIAQPAWRETAMLCRGNRSTGRTATHDRSARPRNDDGWYRCNRLLLRLAVELRPKESRCALEDLRSLAATLCSRAPAQRSDPWFPAAHPPGCPRPLPRQPPHLRNVSRLMFS